MLTKPADLQAVRIIQTLELALALTQQFPEAFGPEAFSRDASARTIEAARSEIAPLLLFASAELDALADDTDYIAVGTGPARKGERDPVDVQAFRAARVVEEAMEMLPEIGRKGDTLIAMLALARDAARWIAENEKYLRASVIVAQAKPKKAPVVVELRPDLGPNVLAFHRQDGSR